MTARRKPDGKRKVKLIVGDDTHFLMDGTDKDAFVSPPLRNPIARLNAYLHNPARLERIGYAMLGMSLTLGALRMASQLRQVLDGMDDDDAPRA